MSQDFATEFCNAAEKANITVPPFVADLLLSQGWTFNVLVRGLDDKSIPASKVITLLTQSSIDLAVAIEFVTDLTILESQNRALESQNRLLESQNRLLALNAELAILTLARNRTSLLTSALVALSATLDAWLNLFDASQIPAVPEEKNFLSEYTKKSRSLDTSFIFPTAPSSTTLSRTESGSTLPMELFRRAQISDPGTQMPVYLLALNDEAVASLVCKKGFGDNVDMMERVIEELEVILRKLRAAVHFRVHVEGVACPELDVIQPMMSFLILRAMQYVLPGGEVAMGQGVSLTAEVLVDVIGAPSMSKTLTGNTDILCYSSKIGEFAETLVAICEVKRAFSKLTKGAHKAKEQLLAKLEGCGQMIDNSRHIVGMLSDLFVISLIVRAPPTPERNQHPAYYQGPCETSPRSFVLRLLLALTNLDAAEYEELVVESTTKLEVPTDDAASVASGSNAASVKGSLGKGKSVAGGSRSSLRNPEAAKGAAKENIAHDATNVCLVAADSERGKVYASENTRGQTAEEQQRRKLSRGADCPEVRAARRKEAVQMALERDYARRGLAHLGEDELEFRNESAGIKRDILSLL